MLLSQSFFKKIFPVPARRRFSIGEITPDITLQGTDGRTYQLSSFRGKPVVLAFTRAAFTEQPYRSSCDPYVLTLNEAYPQFLSLGSELLIVSGMPLERIQAFQQDLSISAPLLSDSSGASFCIYGTGRAFGAPLPAQFVIDEEGRLRFQHLFSFIHANATVARLLWAVRNI